MIIKIMNWFITDKQAAITTIVENDSIPHLKMLDDQVLNELLDKKWKSYAKVCNIVIIISLYQNLTLLVII